MTVCLLVIYDGFVKTPITVIVELNRNP